MDENKVNKGIVFSNPLSLIPYIDEPNTLAYLNSFIPFSTGFEIECFSSDHYNADILRAIPFLIDYNGGGNEFRFRIPSGFAGLICLYFIADEIKTHLTINPLSGIHYHIDCNTDNSFNFINKSNFIHSNYDWIIKELNKWKYKGTYNSMSISSDQPNNAYTIRQDGASTMVSYSSWLKFNYQYRTAEFRLGEMTFNYEVLLRRIMSANSIMKTLKFKKVPTYKVPDFEVIDIQKIIDFLSLERHDFKEDQVANTSLKSNFDPSNILSTMNEVLENMNTVVKSRNISANEFF